MRVLALILMLLGLRTSAQPVDVCKIPELRPIWAQMGCPTLPRFAFAPATGKGMGTACACSSITGAKNEAITFTRASPMTCMKGGETANIANGDLVTCGANLPSVQSGGDGGTYLGLSAWEPRTNGILFPKNLSNAVWVKNGGDFTPTVTANFAIAPDGTSTATRVQLAATTSAQSAYVYQASACAVSMDSMSCFVKGNSGSGTIDLGVNDSSNGHIVAACPFNNTTWSRCLAENVNVLNGGAFTLFEIGNLGFVSGQSRSANDVLIWGCQCEAGNRASPYIDSLDGGSQSRAVQVASVAYSASGASVALGAALVTDSIFGDDMHAASMSFSAGNETDLYVLGAKNHCAFDIGGTQSALNGINNLLIPTTQAATCSYAPTSRVTCAGSQCKPLSGTLTLPTGTATLYIGGQADGGMANGTVRNICADPSAAKCKPAGSVTATCPVVTDNAHTVATIGDSIMVGAFQIRVVDELNDRLCSRSLAAVSYAVSGSHISDCTDQYHNSVKGQGYRDVLTNCGTNDINGGQDAGGAWNMMASLLTDIVHDGGYHVVLGNVTPCQGYSGCVPSVISVFNALEASWCADAGNLATCIDNYTLLGSASNTLSYSGSTHVSALGTLCQPTSDGLHPNNYCTTKLADSFADAVP